MFKKWVLDKTNLIFFKRGKPTKDVWYYEVQGKFTKGKPITDVSLEDCWKKFQKRAKSDRSWIVPAEEIVKRDFDLTAKNPNRKEDLAHKSPGELVKEIEGKEKCIVKILNELKGQI